MIKYDFYRGCYLPSNGTIVNVVIHEFDLNFQGQTFFHYAFDIQNLRRLLMSPADLPRLARPAVELPLF